MRRKRGLQIHTGSLSKVLPKQPGVYLGNKISQDGKSYSVHGGASYTKRSKSGCGCGGKVVKQSRIIK